MSDNSEKVKFNPDFKEGEGVSSRKGLEGTKLWITCEESRILGGAESCTSMLV
jgi:hypothetical protein